MKAWRNRDRSAETSAARCRRPSWRCTAWGLGMLEGLAFDRQPYLASGDSRLKQSASTGDLGVTLGGHLAATRTPVPFPR
ncbi:MAG: hypothetical protein R2719_10870 [Micropruina sp.]